ncbi:MAG TPA: serine hydrolase, partial [Ferruginibacter sp.]|nr:serine hydrolase [Ferruginibacter sp.]
VSFKEFLEKEIFKPLGMARSTVYSRRLENRKIENYAYGYGKNKENKFILPDEDPDIRRLVYTLDGIQGDGTVNASIEDLFTWDRALYTEKLISKAEWEASLETPIFQNNKKSNYGFGWMLDSSKIFGRLMNHSGGWPGYITFIERHIDHNKCFIILSNLGNGNMPYVAVRNILYDIKPKPGNNFKVSADSLRQYEGKYAITPDFVIKVWLEKGTLNAQATGQDSFELVPEKTDWFSVPIIQAKLQFIRNDKGDVTSMILHQNGQETPGKKMD